MTQPTYVNVECFNPARVEPLITLTIAIPAAIITRLPYCSPGDSYGLQWDGDSWFTFDNPQLVLQVPGSFIVRR